MARPKAGNGHAATGVPPGRDKAAEAEALLRAHHALGREVVGRVGEGRLDAAVLKEFTDAGHGADLVRKARVFAKNYTADQLDELCHLRTPEGVPLAWRLVRQLLMLPAGEKRDALQRKAAGRGMSLDELAAAVPKAVRRSQTRRQGGRAFRGPESLSDGLRQVSRHGEEWLRRFTGGGWSGDGWLEGKVGAAGPGG